MLVRALTYREAGLDVAMQKALSGGHQGVMCVRDNNKEGGVCNAAP
jgi:hypothetical protein